MCPATPCSAKAPLLCPAAHPFMLCSAHPKSIHTLRFWSALLCWNYKTCQISVIKYTLGRECCGVSCPAIAENCPTYAHTPTLLHPAYSWWWPSAGRQGRQRRGKEIRLRRPFLINSRPVGIPLISCRSQSEVTILLKSTRIFLSLAVSS